MTIPAKKAPARKAPAKKAPPRAVAAAKKQPRALLVPREDGTYGVLRPAILIRFLLSDGRTLDVITDRDDSDIREAVLRETGVDRIEGAARLPTSETMDNGG